MAAASHEHNPLTWRAAKGWTGIDHAALRWPAEAGGLERAPAHPFCFLLQNRGRSAMGGFNEL
jgi:hypothetical protein